MLREVVVITDDSGTILPPKNFWKSKFGTGIDIREHIEINRLLAEHGLGIPADDLDREGAYREILKDYLRPARAMYAGMFSEVRSFVDELGGVCNADLYILSGRYGLINQNDEIIPHKYHIDTIEKLHDLDAALGFSTKLREICTGRTALIFCLPKHYIAYLNSIGWFETIPGGTGVVMITSKEFADLETSHTNIRVLPRRGVCRVGRENRKKILDVILQDWDPAGQV
ncbi:MAG TPA: hypothetical protein PKV78_05005 [Methanoculleus thermophilus]|nr:hypothetical protein [Methanoculleus thermophilus]